MRSRHQPSDDRPRGMFWNLPCRGREEGRLDPGSTTCCRASAVAITVPQDSPAAQHPEGAGRHTFLVSLASGLQSVDLDGQPWVIGCAAAARPPHPTLGRAVSSLTLLLLSSPRPAFPSRAGRSRCRELGTSAPGPRPVCPGLWEVSDRLPGPCSERREAGS